MKSYVAKPLEIERKWYVIDATDKTLGRLSTEIATRLRGKHKPIYTPHVDCGDFIIVVNAEKVKVTGNKATQKVYRHHTGYMGGLRERSYKEMLAKHPERIIEKAVKGMLPKNSLGSQMYRKLKVYAGPEHDHQAQKPEMLEL
ncbi:MAG: 50S ribosomal protein L13 [Clostridiales bacterium]|jgi:large subunit ribosomal protein L13|nr:50S ribosomal protein L13 [Clostridiales bacterium]